MHLKARNLTDAWISTLYDLLEKGDRTDSRNGEVRSIQGATLRIPGEQGLLVCPERKFSYSYAAAELAWYLSFRDDVDILLPHAPSYKNYLDEGIAFGAYGRRWHYADQLSSLLYLLGSKPDTRQAILQMWNATEPHFDLHHAVRGDRKDLPCTLNLQFLISDDQLNCVCTMRSNDAWMGMPYDIFCFTALQNLIAQHLDLNVGFYQHNVGDLHLYQKHWQRADEIVAMPRRHDVYVAPLQDKMRFFDWRATYLGREQGIRRKGFAPPTIPHTTAPSFMRRLLAMLMTSHTWRPQAEVMADVRCATLTQLIMKKTEHLRETNS